MRAIIRITLPDTDPKKAVELHTKVSEVLKDIKDAEVELTLLAR